MQLQKHVSVRCRKRTHESGAITDCRLAQFGQTVEPSELTESTAGCAEERSACNALLELLLAPSTGNERLSSTESTADRGAGCRGGNSVDQLVIHLAGEIARDSSELFAHRFPERKRLLSECVLLSDSSEIVRDVAYHLNDVRCNLSSQTAE